MHRFVIRCAIRRRSVRASEKSEAHALGGYALPAFAVNREERARRALVSVLGLKPDGSFDEEFVKHRFRLDTEDAVGGADHAEIGYEHNPSVLQEPYHWYMHSEAVIPFLPVWYQYKILPLHDKFLHFRTALQSRL